VAGVRRDSPIAMDPVMVGANHWYGKMAAYFGIPA
jgi:hypothetical protein